MKAAPLGLRLFLEGVEVPVIAAQVEIRPSQPSVASIQIVPADAAFHMKPRTCVHLFFLDPDIAPGDYKEGADQIGRFDVIDTHYKLLFAGEVIGLNYSKSSDQRQLVLQCMDLSIYWDSCYQWFADYSMRGNAFFDKQHLFIGAGTGLFDNVASGTQWVISNLLRRKPLSPQYRSASGLQAGMIHLLEAIGGVRPLQAGFKGYAGVNDFFTVAELRYGLLGMLGAIEKDNTSTKMYAGKAFMSWLKNGMTSMGNLISFRDIIRHVGKWIFHDVYPNPAAYYVEEGTKRPRIVTTTYRESAVGAYIASGLKRANRLLSKASLSFYKASNNDNTQANFVAGEKHLSAAHTIMKQLDPKVGSLDTDDKIAIQGLFSLVYGMLTSNKALAETHIKASTPREALVAPAKAAHSAVGEAKANIEKIIEMKGKLRTRQKKVIDVKGGHLFSQLLLPETFFAPPPRCNVIFPDQYFQFSYSRNFMREVTRLSCQGGLGYIASGGRGGGASARILGYHYFAPTLKDIGGKSLYATMRTSRVILPHEIHSGIIPKYSWIQQAHRWASKAEADGNKVMSSSLKKAKQIGYVQRLANFNFYISRWEARTMQLTGQFNPYLVLGLPAVVINQAAPSAAANKAIEATIGEKLKPVQFLGKIASISHNVHQGGGQTSVAFTHCRTHDGLDDEFFGVLDKTMTRPKNYKVVIRPKQMAKLAAKNNLRPEFKTLMTLYAQNKLLPGTSVEQFGKVTSVAPIGDMVELTPGQAAAIGARTPSSVGGSSNMSLPSSLHIAFERNLTEIEKKSVAFEDAVRPSWYSSVWKNANIGEDVYKPLIGVPAIHDDDALFNPDIFESQEDADLRQESFSSSTLTPGGVNLDDEDGAVVYEDESGVEVKMPFVNLATGKSASDAIDGLVKMYARLKEEGELHDFIRDYTKRPIASMIDVLGSQNFKYNPLTGGPLDPTSMIEGFHSRAFGDYNVSLYLDETGTHHADDDSLTGLLNQAQKSVGLEAVIKGTAVDMRKIDPAVDPRGPARARVLAYKNQLLVSRGLPG